MPASGAAAGDLDGPKERLMDPFEIDTVEIRGVPTKVFVNAPPSLRAVWSDI